MVSQNSNAGTGSGQARMAWPEIALGLGVAAGFGSRRPWIDAPIGFVLALAAYFGFAGALGVNIGAGPFERALGAALGL
jgi:hypothetical protein